MQDEKLVAETSEPKKIWNDALGRSSIRAAQIILIVALISLIGLAVVKVTLVVIPILLALILAAAIAPAVKWMTVRGVPNLLATVIAFVVLLVAFSGVITGIVFAVKAEWDELITHSSDGFTKLYTYIKDGPLPIDDRMIEDFQESALEFLNSSGAGSTALSGLGAVTSFLAGFALMAVVLFFFLKDGAKIWKFFLGFFHGEHKRKIELSGIRTMYVLGGYIRGTATVALVDAFFIGAALFIMQIQLALPLAILIFIGAFIPLVGATAAGAVAVLVALVSNGPGAALIVLLVVIAVNQLEGNLLQPVLMGNALKVHALVVLIALTIGTILAGIVGAILSVPLAAVTWAIIKVWMGRDADYSLLDNPDPETEEAPGDVEKYTPATPKPITPPSIQPSSL